MDYQLSNQYHYDYGMRAVKSILDLAGILKLKNTLFCEQSETNMPKFLADDVRLFNDILIDLFPGMVLEPLSYDMFTKALKNNFEKMHFEFTEVFAEKIMQIYEMIPIRSGVMIIGDALIGKTTSYQVLIEAINEICETDFREEFKVGFLFSICLESDRFNYFDVYFVLRLTMRLSIQSH